MSLERPSVLVVSGFDPSAGAGILADVKTIEQCGAYALGAVSAITFQTDSSFKGLEWVSWSAISQQIKELSKRFKFGWVKVGLIEDIERLSQLVSLVNEEHEVKVVWDPILGSSSGFTFHHKIIADRLLEVLKRVYLVTPNIPEAERLFGDTDLSELPCAVLLKGGHEEGDKELVKDYLFFNGKRLAIEGHFLPNGLKHGSGCVLSSSITAELSKGESLENACRLGRSYTQRFLMSSEGLLGHHANI